MTTQVPNSMLAYDGGSAFRNKIINGCGWIDQRNNNVAVTVNSTANGNAAMLMKTRSNNFTHVLLEWYNLGAAQNYVYTPPQYP